MNKLKKQAPLEICEEFTKKNLEDLKNKQIWMSWWPLMERMLKRSNELEPVYAELCKEFGNPSDTNIPFKLTLEAIWYSGKAFSPDTVVHKKAVHTELVKLHDEIPRLARKLAKALRRQQEIAEPEDFGLGEYLSFVDIMCAASEGNGHYNSFLKPELEMLEGIFDRKYWPNLDDFIDAVAQREETRPEPLSCTLPDFVIQGRINLYKNYVLSLDEDIENCYQIPNSFQLSNASMATIANVALDLPADNLISPDTVRLIRHRIKSSSL